MLRALVEGDFETADEHAERVWERPDGPAEWVGLLAASFAIVVNRRFTADPDLNEVAEFVRGLRERYDTDRLPPMHAEAVIRAALGDEHAVAGMAVEDALAAQTILVPELAADLPDDQREDLIAEATELAEDPP